MMTPALLATRWTVTGSAEDWIPADQPVINSSIQNGLEKPVYPYILGLDLLAGSATLYPVSLQPGYCFVLRQCRDFRVTQPHSFAQ